MGFGGRETWGGEPAWGSDRLLLGSIHCHSTLSDGAGTVEDILAKAAAVGLDYVAVTDHVPADLSERPAPGPESPARAPAPPGAAPPLLRHGVVRVPGLEFSPPSCHCLVLGADPWELPDPSTRPGWPGPESFLPSLGSRAGLLSFLAHPDDEGSAFLKVKRYPWDRWDVSGYTGLEVWNLSTDWSRTLRSYRDILRAAVSGFYRMVPPPHPATLARWDRLAQRRRIVGIAGTDAHAYPVRWHGLRLTVFPYERAFGTLQTAVWVEAQAVDGTPSRRVEGILDALRRGRAFMVNRAWGYPSGFMFQARLVGSAGPPAVSGDTVPAGHPVRFEVAVPWPAWLRLVRNGQVVANTYGREMSFEPLETDGARAGVESGVHEAWRVEVWVNARHWSRAASGFCLWILSNFIYRELA